MLSCDIYLRVSINGEDACFFLVLPVKLGSKCVKSSMVFEPFGGDMSRVPRGIKFDGTNKGKGFGNFLH